VSEQPPWDQYGQQDPRQGQGQPQYPPQQQPYGYRPPYGQQPRQPSYTPDPQYVPPSGEPPYQGQPYQGQPPYPQQLYGRDPYPQGQPPYGREPYPPQGHRQHSHHQVPPRTRKHRRVFLWIFLAIQVLFIAWIVAGAASKTGGTPVTQQVAQQCRNGGWQGLFKSYADCTKHYAVALNDATDAGKGIGVALIVVVWFVVDVILGICYGVYKLARRSA
jgi:hypothetical protein